MTAYLCGGKLLLQFGQETYQGTALFQRAGVFRTAPGVKTALVADADAAAVDVYNIQNYEKKVNSNFNFFLIFLYAVTWIQSL